jgi:hypothetical protein
MIKPASSKMRRHCKDMSQRPSLTLGDSGSSWTTRIEVRWLPKEDVLGQIQFIRATLGIEKLSHRCRKNAHTGQ